MARTLGRRRPPARPLGGGAGTDGRGGHGRGGGPSGGPNPPRWLQRETDGDPLAGVELVLIDGSNLLHALDASAGARGRGGPGIPATPASAVVGRIRGVIPATVRVELLLDGRSSGVSGRLATGMTVRYSGRETADSLIAQSVAKLAADDGPAATWGILVVTDDRELRGRVGALGGRSAGTAWLIRRLGAGRELEPRPSVRGSQSNAQGRDRYGGQSSRRGVGRGPVAPRPKAGTTFGHGRPPRQPRSMDRDEDG